MYFYFYVFVFLLYVYVSSSCQLALFGYPDRFFHAFSSVVSQMPGYNLQRRGTAHTLSTIFVSFCVLLVHTTVGPKVSGLTNFLR